MQHQVEIHLNMMPAFYNKHAGVTYGEPYYFDPAYRAKVETVENALLYDILGNYGVGGRNTPPTTSISIQPIDMIMRTQGAPWRFPQDATVESVGAPWSELTIDEIRRIDPQAAANHSVVKAIIGQYREMKKMYGDKADIFETKTGMMTIHTPYTTAHHLCGENLFVLMLTDPQAARIIFDKIWDIYKSIYAVITKETGSKLNQINLGDCSSSLLSNELYSSVVAPMNRQIAQGFEIAKYHSCGPSTHLLDTFSKLPHLDAIELGYGTDFAAGTKLMPKVKMRPLFDPLLMRDGTPDKVETAASKVLTDTQAAPEVLLCAWACDKETPFENLQALYKTVKAFNK